MARLGGGGEAGDGGQVVGQDLILREVGSFPAVVSEAVRSMLGIEMAAAQALIARAPVVLRERISPALAESLRGKLAPLGATVEVRPHSPAESELCDVFLQDYGGRKIQVVRAVKMALELELREAIELVEEAPTVVRRKVSRGEAEELRHELVEAGAQVEVRAHDPSTPAPAIRASSPPVTPTVHASAPAVSAAPVRGAGQTFAVILHSHGEQKIAVIKAIRRLTGLGLKEAKDLCETPNARVAGGVSEDAAREFEREVVAVGGRVSLDPSGAPVAKRDCEVVLLNCGSLKIAVIKLIRELTALDLAAAKELAETPGATVKADLSLAEAEAIERRFIEFGATVDVRRGAARRDEGAADGVDVYLQSGGLRKIAVIKVVRERTGLGLEETKDLVESAPCLLRTRVDVEEARRWRDRLVEAGATVELRGEAASAVADSARVEVRLQTCGPNKILVIKEVRELMNVGLKQAKNLVEAAPSQLATGVDAQEAKRWQDRLVAAGATVELRPG